MWIQSLSLKNFRCFESFEIEFSEGINVIHGQNGAGKTSVLEALHLLSIGKSFRPNIKGMLMRKGSENFALKGEIENSKQVSTMEYFATKEERRIKLNGDRMAGFSGILKQFPVVIFSPEQEETLSGSNSFRRDYFDRVLSICDAEYLRLLREMKHIIRQKTVLLQMEAFQELDVWNLQLSERSAEIWKKRSILLQQFSDIFEKNRQRFIPNTNALVKYVTPEYADADLFYKKLENNKGREIASQRCLYGPTRDQFRFELMGRNLRNFASQGEKLFFLTLLKRCEFDFFTEFLEEQPVLLLDDVFSKLDSARSQKVLEFFRGDFQSIFTGTSQNFFGLHTQDQHHLIALS